MKKKRCFLILVLTLSVLVSCADTVPNPSLTDGENTQPFVVDLLPVPLSSFQLVRPDRASEELTDAIVDLNAKVKNQLGSALKIRIDLSAERETNYEILIGDCRSAASRTWCAPPRLARS